MIVGLIEVLVYLIVQHCVMLRLVFWHGRDASRIWKFPWRRHVVEPIFLFEIGTVSSRGNESMVNLFNSPGLASGFNIHHDDLPVPSFWTRMKRLCRERLCRMEF